MFAQLRHLTYTLRNVVVLALYALHQQHGVRHSFNKDAFVQS